MARKPSRKKRVVGQAPSAESPSVEELLATQLVADKHYGGVAKARMTLSGWSIVARELSIINNTDSSTLAVALCRITVGITHVGRLSVFDTIATREDLLPVTRGIARALKSNPDPLVIAPLIERWNNTPAADAVYWQVFVGLPNLLRELLDVEKNLTAAWRNLDMEVSRLDSLKSPGQADNSTRSGAAHDDGKVPSGRPLQAQSPTVIEGAPRQVSRRVPGVRKPGFLTLNEARDGSGIGRSTLHRWSNKRDEDVTYSDPHSNLRMISAAWLRSEIRRYRPSAAAGFERWLRETKMDAE